MSTFRNVFSVFTAAAAGVGLGIILSSKNLDNPILPSNSTTIDEMLKSGIDIGLQGTMLDRLQQGMITEDQYSAIMLQSRSLSIRKPDDLIDLLKHKNQGQYRVDYVRERVIGMSYGYPQMDAYVQYLSPTLYELDIRIGPFCPLPYEERPEEISHFECNEEGKLIAYYFNADENGLEKFVYIGYGGFNNISFENVDKDKPAPATIEIADLNKEDRAALQSEIDAYQALIDQSKESFKQEFQEKWPKIEEELDRWGYVPDAIFAPEEPEIIYVPYQEGP